MAEKTSDLTKYHALKSAKEFWVVGGLAPIVFRFGPFDAEEVGPIIERALHEGISLTIIGQCGREIDWAFLNDAQADDAALRRVMELEKMENENERSNTR